MTQKYILLNFGHALAVKFSIYVEKCISMKKTFANNMILGMFLFIWVSLFLVQRVW